MQNGAAPKATQTEQYAEPQRARRKGKQSAAAAKREPVEASAADADKSEAAQPKRRAKKAAAAKQGALTHSLTWLLLRDCLYFLCQQEGGVLDYMSVMGLKCTLLLVRAAGCLVISKALSLFMWCT